MVGDSGRGRRSPWGSREGRGAQRRGLPQRGPQASGPRPLRITPSLPPSHQPFGLNSRAPAGSPAPRTLRATRSRPHPPPSRFTCAHAPIRRPRRSARARGGGTRRRGAGPRAVTDSPAARPGRSLRSRSGGREGGGAGFPAGGAEPALEEEEEEEEKGAGGSGSRRPECRGPRGAGRTPRGEARRGETAGPPPGWAPCGRRQLTFSAGSAGASVPWLLPSSFAPPNSDLPHLSLRRFALPAPPAALFPWSAWAGVLGGAGRAFRGAGEPARPQALPGAPSPNLGRWP